MSRIDGREFQVAFGRILAEPDLNERFVADPGAVGDELGLDDEQIAALTSIGLERLSEFSHRLASKRIGLLKKVCPATYERAHQARRLGELAGGFVRSHPPIESKDYPSRTIRDGFWFIDHLLALDEAGTLDDPLLADVARFERALLTVTALAESVESATAFEQAARELEEATRQELLEARPRTGPHAAIERFGREITEVIKALGAEQAPDAVHEGPPRDDAEQIVLFSKLPGWRNVRYAAINRLTRDLLAECDGFSTSREIAARLLRQSLVERDPQDFAESCLGVLTRLTQMNVLTFDR